MGWKIKLLFFVSIIIILDRSIAKILDNLVASNYAGFSTGPINYYCSGKASDVLFLGSSRVIHQIVPDSISLNCFVLGSHNKHLHYQSCIVDLLKQKKKLPKSILVLHVEPEDFFVENSIKLSDEVHYLRYYYNQNNYIQSEINKNSIFEPLKYVFDSYRHNGNVTEILNHWNHHKGFIPKNNGYVPLEAVQASTQQDLRSSRFTEKENSYDLASVNPKAVDYLLQIKKTCVLNKIKLIVFSAPYFKAPINSVNASKVLNVLMDSLDVQYLNYINLNLNKLFPSECWHDNSHFNDIGGRRFSNFLNDKF
jgi:hypothetical protein